MEENSHVHDNGLNYKTTENVEKRGKVGKEINSLVRDNS